MHVKCDLRIKLAELSQFGFDLISADLRQTGLTLENKCVSNAMR